MKGKGVSIYLFMNCLSICIYVTKKEDIYIYIQLKRRPKKKFNIFLVEM